MRKQNKTIIQNSLKEFKVGKKKLRLTNEQWLKPLTSFEKISTEEGKYSTFQLHSETQSYV